jgi:microcystin-dependent protein
MAISENAVIESWTAGTTFGSTSIYKFVVADAQGHVIDAAGGSTNTYPVGVLYGRTQTTTTEAEAVPVAVGGVVKVQAVASTIAVGNFVACTTAGYAGAPTTDNPIAGIVKYGSSGGTGRVLSVQLWKFGPTAA